MGCGFSAIQLAFKLLHEGPLSETLTEPYYATGSGLVLLAGLGAVGVSFERHASSRRAASRRDDAAGSRAASASGAPPRPPDGVAGDDASS
ncbi:hypothetical protein [Frondihabitans cladoniiphilus]|uniref:Uncharacterized protein n=1 Tax=Frondihabitans cladoniiphilus TaxID=715785 RepID=A0ABP8WCW1_9MICO